MTRKEAAKFLNVSRQTIWRYIKKGYIRICYAEKRCGYKNIKYSYLNDEDICSLKKDMPKRGRK